MMKKIKMEVLAPVGGQEQLLAAVRCGADAIYLGAKGFNARRNAENFEDAGLAQAMAYCRGRGVRVYVTVNTLVMDDEMPALLDTVREVAHSGPDAVIVQDLAVARLIRACCPDVELHASTQMAIHNAAGVRMLQDLGFTRVVLARELTIDEIAAIKAQTDLSLEVFVHGALCMSVSGACYLSAMLGGRSGNRGLCAQPCRLDFSSAGRPYALSLKDLSALQHLRALSDAGVSALKIEGRMKRPEYVAAAVTACRQALSGEPFDLDTLESVFSRGGFTDGYLTGKRSLEMFGIRRHEDVQASQRVLGSLSRLYQKERPAVPVDAALLLAREEPAALTVTDGTHVVTAFGDMPQEAQTAPVDEERARRSISRMGDTPFWLQSLTVRSQGGLALPAAGLNGMRREALRQLMDLREAPLPHRFCEPPPLIAQAHIPKVPAMRVRVENKEQLEAVGRWLSEQESAWADEHVLGVDRVIVPVDWIDGELIRLYGERLMGEMPALVFPLEEAELMRRCHGLRDMGLQRVLCNNLGTVRMAKEAGLTACGGYGLNLLNTEALSYYAGMGLEDATVSFELHAQKIQRLGGALPRGIIAYGFLPLMLLRNCPAKTKQGCGPCKGHATLTDRMGIPFSLRCQNRRYATLYNSVPLNLSGEAISGVDFFTLWLTGETAADTRRIVDDFSRGVAEFGERTRGLYYRTLR